MKKILMLWVLCITTLAKAINPTLRNVNDTILTTLEQCCSQIDGDLFTTKTVLNEINSKIDNIQCSSSACAATPISSVPTTIATAGSYCLAQNLNVPSGDGITISASNVVLDLNNHSLVGTGGNNGVIISSGSEKVIIKNGIICDMAESGIVVESDNCTIQLCELVGNATGINLNFAHNNYLRNCIARSNLNAGFALLSSSTNCILDCQALNNGSNTTSYGFTSSGGSTNLFERCIADGTNTITTATTDLVAGIALIGEQNTKVINCRVDGTSSLRTSTVSPYGIFLGKPGFFATEVATFNAQDEFAIDWSPDGVYLAGSPLGGPDQGILKIRKFSNESFVTVTSYTPTPATASNTFPIWSPDGHYIAELGDYRGTPSYNIAIYYFDANATETLTQRATLDYGGTLDTPPSWSPTGTFFAGSDSSSQKTVIFEFDASTDTVITRTAISQPNSGQLSWSSTGYLAAETVDTSAAPTYISTVNTYTFNEITYDLTLTVSAPETKTDVFFRSVRWSPNGTYLLSHGTSIGNLDNMLVYQFTPPATLTKISEQFNASPEQFFFGSNHALYSAWSPDSSFFVIAGYPTTDPNDSLYRAAIYTIADDGVLQYLAPFGPTFEASWPAWSSQNYLALAKTDLANPLGLVLFSTTSNTVGSRPVSQSCFLKNNTICYTNGGNNLGIGISGALNNVVISNTAYKNDTNYLAVPNIHIGITGTPKLLDNISLSNNDPIVVDPIQVAVDDMQTRITNIDTKVDALYSQLPSQIDAIDSKADACCEITNSKIDLLQSKNDYLISIVDLIWSKVQTLA